MEKDVLYFELFSNEGIDSLVAKARETMSKSPTAMMAVFECGGLSGLSEADFSKLVSLLEQASTLSEGALFLGDREMVSRIEASGVRPKLRAVVANARDRLPGGSTDSPASWVFGDAIAQAVESISMVKSEPVTLESMVAKFDSEVGGTADFVLSGVPGKWILSIPSESLIELVSRIMGERQTLASPGLMDWPAEIINMGSAAVKEAFAKSNKEIRLAIPKLAQAEDLKSIRKMADQTSSHYFKTEIGPFLVEIIMNVSDTNMGSSNGPTA